MRRLRAPLCCVSAPLCCVRGSVAAALHGARHNDLCRSGGWCAQEVRRRTLYAARFSPPARMARQRMTVMMERGILKVKSPMKDSVQALLSQLIFSGSVL